MAPLSGAAIKLPKPLKVRGRPKDKGQTFIGAKRKKVVSDDHHNSDFVDTANVDAQMSVQQLPCIHYIDSPGWCELNSK